MSLVNLCSTNPRQSITCNIFQKLLLTVLLLFLGLSSFHASAAPSSLSFNGSNTYVDTTDAAFQLANGTWEAWFKVSSLSSNRQAIIAKDQTGYSDDGWLGIENNSSGGNSNKLYFYIDKSSGSTAYPIYSDSAVVAGTWYHVAVIWGSGGMKMYVDGTLQGQTDANTSGMVSSGTNLRVGARDSFVSYDYFNGLIDEVRVWNVARTQAEIDQYKGVTLTGSESGLLAYYQFDDGSGTTAVDLAGGNQNGTLVSSPTWNTTNATVTYAPTTSTSSLTATAPNSTSLTFNWINGNGASRLVLMTQGNMPPVGSPLLATGYTANTVFGSGSLIGAGNYVVYNGSGATVTVTNLSPNTQYTASVYEFNGSGTTANYNNSAPGVTGTTKSTQTITFNPTTTGIYNGSQSLNAAASSTLTTFTFASTTPSVCTITSSPTVNYIAVGTCTLTADQAGDANYEAAPQVSANVTVNQGNQTITSFPAPANLYVGQTEALSATADSGLAVTFGSNTPTICTVPLGGSTVSYIATGTCTLTADQAGNTNYSAAPQVTSGMTILPGNQTISFNATTGTVGSSATPATATSNLAVTFTSSTTSICTTSGSTVNYIAAGTCTLTADQAGNTNYNAAPQVSGNITVTDPPPPAAPTYPLTNSTPASGQTIQFDTLVGQKQTKSITLKNFGSAALFFNSINTPIAPFSYPKPMPFTFIPYGDASGSAKTLELSCTPTEMSSKTMTLQIATNDPDLPTLSYPLECMGRLPVVVSSVANNMPLNFGNTLINSMVSQSIDFSENGNTNVILNSATITGVNAADFQITAPTTFPVTVANGATNSQTITVSCTPKTATPLTATLQITTNDPVNATLNYPLQCGGLFSLTLNTTGQGTIGGCGTSCVQNYQQDAAVTVSATPATGWQFSSWSGDCVNGQVVMTGNKSCGATFTQIVENPTTPSDTTGTTTPTGTTTTPTNTTTTPSTPTIPTATTGNSTTTTPPTITTPPTGTTPGNTNTSNPLPTDTNSSGGSDNMISVIAAAPTNNGVVSGSMSNYNQVATNLTIPENSSVSGGTLAGAVTNGGLVANVTIASNSTVTGGKLSGFNTNLGTLNNVTVSQYSQVQGGNYTGTIYNQGILINPIVLPAATIVNTGTIANPLLLSGATLLGGRITGVIITLGGTYQNTQVPIGTRIITKVADIPPEIFAGFDAQTLAALPRDFVSQITPEQFTAIPVAAISGLTSENMGAISPQVIQTLDKEQIEQLNPDEFKAMPTEEVAKLLTNFDAEQITPQEAEKLLPQRWTIDSYGNLTAPPGIRISLKILDISNLPPGLTLPNTSDLNSSFALGGRGTHPVLNQINQMSATEGFSVAQQKTGVVHASSSETQKRQFSFMVDPDMIFLLDENALRGLQMNEQGQYIIVTEDGKQIPITPMTKDPEALLSVLGDNSGVDIQKTGEVLLKFNEIKRSRSGDEVHRVGMFDPFVEPAPEDICTPEGICDWSKADASMQPGIRSGRNLRAKSMAKVIYPDGTAQQVYPTVLSPEILVAEAQKIAGVEKIIFRMDGTFAVTYQGFKLLLIPDAETQVQPIPVGKTVEPSLTLESNTRLLYQVPYQEQIFITILTVTEAPAS